MEMHLDYGIQIRIWPNIWKEKKHSKNNTCSNYQKNRLGNSLRVNLHCIRIHHNIAYAKAKCNTSQLPSRVKDLASVITCSSRHY